MTGTCAARLLDVIQTFIGHLQCGAQSAGIDALLAADLTFSQMRTMLTLAQHPEPVPIHEIADRLGLSVAAAGRNVDQLVRAGLVERVEDDLDRRIKRISLNGAGFELIVSVKDGQRRAALDLLADIDERDAERLIDALRPVVAKLGCTGRPAGETSDVPLEVHHSHRQEIPA